MHTEWSVPVVVEGTMPDLLRRARQMVGVVDRGR
jgi:hypothetical protein